MTQGVDRLTRAFTEGRMSRRQLMLRLLALGLSLPAAIAILEACGGGNTTGGTTTTTSKKPKLILGFTQEPTSLDPTMDATASISTILRDNVYEGLVRLDPGGKVIPGLATKWDTSPDGKTITFHLAPNVKWHDGSSFSSADVKFSWERAAGLSSTAADKPNPHKDYWAPVASIDTPDANTVKVSLKAYSFNWLFHMTAGSACIFSSKSQPTNATQPVGTGPFKFVGWNKGSALTLTRNDAYWGDKAKLKDLEYRFITDANGMNNALKAGDIDVIAQVSGPEQAAGFKADSAFQVLEADPVGKVMVSLNNTKGALANPKVRKAIAMAIDHKAWIDALYAGYAVPIGSHSAPNAGEPYYVDENGVNPHDATKAKALLAEAGVSNLTLRLSVVTDFPYAVRGGDILTSALKDIGITVKTEGTQFAGWLKNTFLAGDYDMTIINHVEERDIANWGNPKYYWHYDNSQVQQWLTQADAEVDDTKRKDLYGKILKQLADDAAGAWVCSPKTLFIAKKSVQSFPASAIAPFFMGNVYFS